MIIGKDELHEYMDSLKGEEFEMLLLFEIYTGLRQNDIIALNWDNISFEDKKVSVNKALIRIRVYDENKNDYVAEWKYEIPKTKENKRDIPLTDSLVEKLKKYKDEQKKYFENNNIANEENLVFTDKTGRKIMHHIIRNFNRYIAKKADLEYITFSTFRNSFALSLIEKRLPIKTVASLLGHSSLKTTYRIYKHAKEVVNN